MPRDDAIPSARAAPPGPGGLPRLLRLEVGRLRQRESRQVFPTAVCAGTPGGDRHRVALDRDVDTVLDAGMRAALLDRMLAGSPTAEAAWLERPGEPVVQDVDQAWLGAALHAFAAVGRPLVGFWVLTRSGWLDVRSGEQRCWVRLRL